MTLALLLQVAVALAPVEPVSYRLGVWGDSQEGHQVFAQVCRRFAAERVDGLLSLGDLIQHQSLPESEWPLRFLAPAAPLLHLPRLGTRGNHDDALGWSICANSIPVPVLPGGGQWHALTLGPVRFLVLDSNVETYALRVSMHPGGAQRAFVEAEVSRPEWRLAPHRVALWHHPVMTEQWAGCYYPPWGGARADPDWLWCMDRLAAAGCSLCLQGHSHSYQRGAWRGMAWVITGGGGGWLDQTRCGDLPEITVNAGAGRQEHHYLTLDVTPWALTLTAKRIDGTEFDHVRLP